MALWTIAGMTFREAARKKILWTALLAGLGFLAVFGIGLHYQMADFKAGTMPPFLRYQILTREKLIQARFTPSPQSRSPDGKF